MRQRAQLAFTELVFVVQPKGRLPNDLNRERVDHRARLDLPAKVLRELVLLRIERIEELRLTLTAGVDGPFRDARAESINDFRFWPAVLKHCFWDNAKDDVDFMVDLFERLERVEVQIHDPKRSLPRVLFS